MMYRGSGDGGLSHVPGSEIGMIRSIFMGFWKGFMPLSMAINKSMGRRSYFLAAVATAAATIIKT
jgi:hypothetical protein